MRKCKDFKPEDHFDDFEAVNAYYKKQADGTLRHETDLVVDRGIDFLKRQEKGKPFALNLWFNACHAEDSDHRPGSASSPGRNRQMDLCGDGDVSSEIA